VIEIAAPVFVAKLEALVESVLKDLATNAVK
jgi:hypothetical protein